MTKYKTVALLPMKAHSERVPGKNFKNLAGKPLYKWMLDTLLEVKELDKIIINTDAREILEESGLKESDRVVIRDRKQELCGDMVSMNNIIQDDMEAYPAELYLMTHTTNPLLSVNTIEKALETYRQANKSQNINSLFSVVPVQKRFYRENISPVNHDPKNLLRTQDLEKWFEETSAIYLFTKEGFSSTNTRIGSNPLMFETPKLESVDIDDPEDWILAEALAKHSK